MEDVTRQKPVAFREESSNVAPSADVQSPPIGIIGNTGSAGKSKDNGENQGPELIDPLAGMPEVDKWGIKGLRTLMNNYPDYHAMVVGMDPNTLGLDLSSPE